MKAAVLINTGDINDLNKNLVIDELPVPEISSDEVLIRVKYASLNHRDLWITKGRYSKIKLPVVLGSDCCGVAEKVGSSVNNISEGDEVIINPGLNWGNDERAQSKEFKILGMPDNGTFAEYVKVKAENVFKKPVHLDFEKSAAFPLAGLTAFRAAFKKIELSKNDTVVITGIGGGVATFALNYAIAKGATVFVTSGNNDKIDKAISLGAKGGAIYKNEGWEKVLNELSFGKISAVIDGTGGEGISKLTDVINPGGRMVCYGATLGSIPEFSVHKLYWKQLKLFGSTMGSPKDFSEMISYIEEKNIEPVIEKTFQPEDIVSAFELMDSGKQFGKIVVKI